MTSVIIEIDLETKPGEPLCSRTIDIPLKARVLGLHWVIQSVFGWQDDLPFTFTSARTYHEDGSVEEVPMTVGSDDEQSAGKASVDEMLRNTGDKLTYGYGDWKCILTVTATGGRQRTQTKVVDVKGPCPVQDSRKAPGGWGAMWKTLTKLYQAKTLQGQHVIYNKMSKKERAIVDFIGNVHDAYDIVAARKEVGLEDLQRLIPGVNIFPGMPIMFRLPFHGEVSEEKVNETLEMIRDLMNERVPTEEIQEYLDDNRITEDTDLDAYFAEFVDDATEDCYGADCRGQLTPEALNHIIGQSRNAWDVVLNVVKWLSPHPQVAQAMEKATKRHQHSDLTAAEVEIMVEPLRECLRVIGSDNARTSLSRLAEVKWKAFSEIIGHKFNDEESRNHCLIPYLRMGEYFGLMEQLDWRGRMQLTQYGREVLAKADHSMDEVERARTNRELIEELVPKIPHGDGPLVSYSVINLGILLALDDMQEIAGCSRAKATQMYNDTLHAVSEALNIEEFGGIANANAFSSSIMHLMEFSGFVDVDFDAGTQSLNSAGARFFSKCLRELTYHRVVDGLHDAAYSKYGYEKLAS